MKIGVIGCAGRMGRTLIQEVLNCQDCSLVGGTERLGNKAVDQDLGELAGLEKIGVIINSDVEGLIRKADAIIDFTKPEVTVHAAELAAQHNKIHIIGTTGLNPEQFNKIKLCSRNATIVLSSNFSIGVNLLLQFTESASRILGNDYDIEILEMHHKLKEDAPSGTALSLGEAAAAGRGQELKDVPRTRREGHTGPRRQGEIGFATLRGGDVVGDHTVIFATEGERIELTHKASSRAIFAQGAIRAALWAKGRPAGLYSMQDVLSA